MAARVHLALLENVLDIHGSKALVGGRERGAVQRDHVLDHMRMPGYPELMTVGNTEKRDEDPKIRNGAALWHTDQSCMETPPMGTILYIHTVPPDGGGDTMFASMYAAYDALSENMKRYLEGVTALHDGAGAFAQTANNKLPVTEQPVIAKHPVTGRKLLYVNPIFTTRICGVSKDESDAILSYLFHHCEHPNFQVRFNWSPHSIAFWDNRCTHHRALWDYYPNTRSGFRIQIQGTDRVMPG